ncbi:DUF1822 family protein [Funiculus sociatus GB2-M2]|uniref:DUF1822 family protein n=1 Tax=Funiculus sociatus TaxID=450527 RepID=UPI00329956D5
MNHLTNSLLTVSVPLTARDRTTAERFAKQQPNAEKYTQVYRNTLAVLATHRYLEWLSIESTYEQSQSWNRFGQTFSNIADLFVYQGKGSLECRAIHPGDDRCFIPEDVQRDRIGYVMVQLDTSYREAVLLGFVPHVSVTHLPLSYLQPLDSLIDQVTGKANVKPITQLSSLIKGVLDQGWQANHRPEKQSQNLTYQMRCLALDERQPVTTEEDQSIRAEKLKSMIEQFYQKAQLELKADSFSLDDPQAALVSLIRTTQNDEIRWQAAELLSELDPAHPLSPVISTKDLGMYLSGHAIALQVGVLEKPDGRLLILLRLFPNQPHAHLPTGLQLIGFDDTDNLIFQMESRLKDGYIQCKLAADAGDRFRIQIQLGETSVFESFQV